MKKIIHLSDLHFGRENRQLVVSLLEIIPTLEPDLVIISGDFTQRATDRQFLAAQQFLAAIKVKTLCVPGNHDMPVYRFWERCYSPYQKYQHYIHHSLHPSYSDNVIKILGINSTSRWHAKNGKVSATDFECMRDFFQKEDAKKINMVVMHHNLVKLSHHHHPIINHMALLAELAALRVHVVLCGHLHLPHIGQRSICTDHHKHQIYLLTAGTATSNRLRLSNNSFNVLEIEQNEVTVKIYHVYHGQFSIRNQQDFSLSI